MIPILHDGRLVYCGPQQKKIHLRHCPACGDRRESWCVWAGSPSQPVDVLVDCPVCGPTAGLWRLLDRRLA